MKIFEFLRRWWQERTGEEETPFDGDTPAWIISIGFHLVVLVVLAVVWMYGTQPDILLTMPDAEEEEEQLVDKFHFSKDPQEAIGANSMNGAEMALASADIVSEISDTPVEIEPQVNPTVNVQMNVDLATAPSKTQNLNVKGAAGVGATGAAGAIDRITHEILLSLEERKTLVVWLFDQSGSLDRTRAAIYDRFDRIYHELQVVKESGNEAFAKYKDKDMPLLTAVMAFGKEVSHRTKDPTADLDAIKKAIKEIPTDATGVENVFRAVGEGVTRYGKYRTSIPRRNVMFVIVSDEVGDDERYLDACVTQCQRAEVPVYVIGVPAPFGRREAKIKWVDSDPKFDQSVQWIPVRQGPESVMPERIKLNFSADNNRDLDELGSGFGPFALTRLCYETGGIYFAVHPKNSAAARAHGRQRDTEVMSSRLRYFFDPAVMRRYRPDYVSIGEYQQLLMQNNARAALVKAAQMSRVGPMDNPQTRFPKQNEGALKRLLDEAQKTAAKLEPKINAIYMTLQMGEKDRTKLNTPRWQAGYDLAMGRAMAMKVRTETYNQILAQLKEGRKFKNPKNDTWVLKPADNTIGSRGKKEAEAAKTYLQRVVDTHPGTPWALLAKKELETPLGWVWDETYTGVNEPRRGAGNGNNNPNPADMLNKLKRRPPKRTGVKL